ncbi:hypothetical protein F5879DRAFT_918296 [Lentinula edodes]|uniref:Secreted protein n=1 Tax=Lentinula edodes TaxID=5353 RepID=A0A1Q3E964_LENED|nr:uncharacterized protein C8R40DRAFT_1081823 [Lentinula edodes]KAH7880771.1 hypothetical protein C8R40DRAFT_1081823 [Lentinula edodes]KAJ3909516.1 hypothetical protein F5879DRAFT_918296 [Lentinula edodes]KAJ3917303.1 hypothetical protein F5877DRAFT_68357 [Lentinula edodes]GAW03614.1 hypothetical protein LENED_005351 [Lentinula edodes]
MHFAPVFLVALGAGLLAFAIPVVLTDNMQSRIEENPTQSVQLQARHHSPSCQRVSSHPSSNLSPTQYRITFIPGIGLGHSRNPSRDGDDKTSRLMQDLVVSCLNQRFETSERALLGHTMARKFDVKNADLWKNEYSVHSPDSGHVRFQVAYADGGNSHGGGHCGNAMFQWIGVVDRDNPSDHDSIRCTVMDATHADGGFEGLLRVHRARFPSK